jgi:hypothetical protein
MRIYVVNPKIPIAAIKIHCEMASEMRWTGIVFAMPFYLAWKGAFIKKLYLVL